MSQVICPQCATPNNHEAWFCSICGAALATIQCPVCQAMVSNNTKFCPACGHQFGGSVFHEESIGELNPGIALTTGMVLEDRYIVEKIIGQGGNGTVYLAVDQWSIDRQKQCAIKELSDTALTAESRAEAINAFKREVGILTHLNHAHIPHVTDYFTLGHRHYLVMDYIDGQNLQDIIDSHSVPFPEKQVVDWAIQLCQTLTYLHTHQPPIIFKDLKPLNLMVDRQNQVKLIDFGIARLFNPTQKDSQKLGSSGFSPLEQAGGRTDARSDIYALGATLHYLFTLHDPTEDPPFADKIPVRQINPTLSPGIEQIVMKAVQSGPDKRYQTAAEMEVALKKGLAGTPDEAQSTPQSIQKSRKTGRYKPASMLIILIGLISAILMILVANNQIIAATYIAGFVGQPVLSPTPTSLANSQENAIHITATPTRNPTSTVVRKPTASPTRKLTRTPTPKPSPSGVTVSTGNATLFSYNHDFSFDDGNWDVGHFEDDHARTDLSLVEGKYRISLAPKDAKLSYQNCPNKLGEWQNFVMSVDMWPIAGPFPMYYGISFRGTDWDNYYWLLVNNKGEYSVSVERSGQSESLVPWTFVPTIQNADKNHISIKANGSTFEVVINNQDVTTIIDDKLKQGNICLFIGQWGDSYAGTTTTVDFDNLSVMALP